jgi:hypothetical protein
MDKDQVRQDENTKLAQMADSPGFKVLQKMAKDLEEINIKSAYSDNGVNHEIRLIKLGEIAGMRKLLQLVVSRSESESKSPSWTEHKGVPAWQTSTTV